MAGNPKDELDKYNPLDLFRIYCPDASTEDNCKSPLRSNDDTPSFRLFWGDETLMFNDFGLGEIGDIYKFVRMLYGLTYREALEKVYSDVKSLNYKVSPIDYTPGTTSKSEIKFKPVKPTEAHRNFWNDYLTYPKITLKRFKIFPIESYAVNNKIIYCYSITFAIVIGSRIKIYQPGQSLKYLGNTNKNSIQGWHVLDSLPNGTKIYIVSSLKEVMVLYEQGIHAIAFNSETSKPDKEIIDKLKKKFIFELLYDWDDGGIKGAEKASEYYDIPINPLQYAKMDEKDLSDYRKKYGFNKFKTLCEKL